MIGRISKKGPQNIGKNVAGNGTKIHVLMGKEDPICVALTGAQVHDSQPVKEMIVPLEGLAIERFVADKGYDDDSIKEALEDQDIHPEMGPKKSNKQQIL